MIHHETSSVLDQTENQTHKTHEARKRMREAEFGNDQSSWERRFSDLYETAVKRYGDRKRGATEVFTDEDSKFLASIGATPQEIYDFVEDWSEVGEPSFDVVRRITQVRRDYFLQVQKGRPSPHKVSMDTLPPMRASLGGFTWLPRIIEKAKAKLRGEMPPDLMYGCGGDRPFLQKVRIEPDEFLRLIWNEGDNGQKILDYVKMKAK